MKKLMIAALMVVGMTSFAQEKVQTDKLTPAQRNEIQLKKLTLNLDLNDKQQKEMSVIIAEQGAKREAMIAKRKENKVDKVKLTADERFAKQKAMLDEKIAVKERVKKILTPTQFEKWEKMNEKKRHGAHDKMSRHNRKDAKKEDITK